MAIRLMICLRLLNISKGVKDGGTGKTINGRTAFFKLTSTSPAPGS